MNYQLCVYRVEAMQKWSQNCFAEGDTPWQKKKKKKKKKNNKSKYHHICTHYSNLNRISVSVFRFTKTFIRIN